MFDVEIGILAQALRLSRHHEHGNFILKSAMHAHASLQQSHAGMQEHSLRSAGHEGVSGGHVYRDGLVPGFNKTGSCLVLELLTRQCLPHRRPLRTGRGHDVVDPELAKGFQDSLATVYIVPHSVAPEGGEREFRYVIASNKLVTPGATCRGGARWA